MKLTVVRHGESTFNREGRYAGSTDVPLTEAGIRQARALAQLLKDRRFDAVVSSPMARALTTAQIVNEALNLPLTTDEAFVERNVGVYEGLTQQEIQATYPGLWHSNCTRQTDGAPNGGETLRQVDTRVREGLLRLQTQYGSRHVLLVCHGFVSRAINRIVNDIPFEQMHTFKLDNCQTAEYEIP